MRKLGIGALCLLAGLSFIGSVHAGGGGIGKGTIMEDPESP